MLFWTLVFVLVSLGLLLGNFFQIPREVYHVFPLITLLGSLGLLYRTLYKIRNAEKENYRHQISKLKDEINDYKKKIVQE